MIPIVFPKKKILWMEGIAGYSSKARHSKAPPQRKRPSAGSYPDFL